MENLLTRTHNPDVLTCIANLSNDEVFTPPEMASAMLDMVAEAWAADHNGENLWANPNVTFLDPFTKTGVFLREITRRLVEGLEAQIPDLQERVNHVLTKQVHGIAITELTALMARRSVYCSKRADGEHSICTSFDHPHGNIWFERTEHTWTGGTRESRVDPLTGEEIFIYTGRKCSYCGAGENDYGRGDALETHAYAFIHTDDIKQRINEIFGAAMHFDIVIGNPPYQLSTEGHGNQARPIYQLFVNQAKCLEPNYLIMVTPSRWLSGGMGLNQFRTEMATEHKLVALVDFPKLYDAFPGVKIRGGASYFIWSKNHNGPCEITTRIDGEIVGEPVIRFLDEFDIVVRQNEAVPILEKVLASNEPTMDALVSSQKPFGLATNFKGKKDATGLSDPVRVYANQSIIWVDRSEISRNQDCIDQWKVLMTRIQGTSAAVETKFLSKPIIEGPGTACTETYLIVGPCADKSTAASVASYIRTRFFRFLVSLRKPTQDALKQVYAFVPQQTWDRTWTDEALYAKYGLNDEEIAFIESIVRPMEDD
ncbi:Eco57I restriction-modification methylase domain-containing protein [Corynebacterium matruchotii]|jgi:site-specific DNA-methyltransferase (adenine-specific)|uniref:Eco57I restriction-modification methylase domain-containing protein n=1 Tax=Corynebacterium matruchotii TaxID=43768 RepID=UPI003C6F6AE0